MLPSRLPPLDVPIDLGREEARRQAIGELADPAYRTARPSWLEQLVSWLVDKVSDWASRASAAAPGGLWGLLGLAALVIGAVVFIRWRLGPVRRADAISFEVDPTVSAVQYRDRAAGLAREGRWAEAISERMRAIIRASEERGIADARPGRTADELADLVATQAPEAGVAMAAAADVFDRVRYGGRPGTQGGYETMARADEALMRARPRRDLQTVTPGSQLPQVPGWRAPGAPDPETAVAQPPGAMP